MIATKNLVWGNEEEVLAQVLECPTPIPSEIAVDGSPCGTGGDLPQGTEKDPADRYPSVNALVQDPLRTAPTAHFGFQGQAHWSDS